MRYFGALATAAAAGADEAETPIGTPCGWCSEPIATGDRGTFVAVLGADGEQHEEPQHVECGLRAVIGGWGHLSDHRYWCVERHDSDGGLTPRESALKVWRHFTHLHSAGSN